MRNLRWKIADWISWIACKLRGHDWYLGEAWYAVPGNRAADLQQLIWTDIVLIATPFSSADKDALDRTGKHLAELAQAAGENWGHIKHNSTDILKEGK